MSIDGRGIDMLYVALADLEPELFTLVVSRLVDMDGTGESRLGAYVRNEIDRWTEELTKHSEMLNTVMWRLGEALGYNNGVTAIVECQPMKLLDEVVAIIEERHREALPLD